uniref:Ubiquitin-like protease family profile domain-containing protein n=1 Tax=Oryza nivara TaxID=4536 RepID=A0A0E0FHV5_ORYNI
MRHMVFVPFNVMTSHWSLLVVNSLKKEIQILNSAVSMTSLRDEEKEERIVTNLQLCIERAVEGGLVTLIEPINITLWKKQYYTDIPQQMDCRSCGVYLIKYMLEWDGDKMLHQFTQEAEFLSKFERDIEGEEQAMDDDVKIIGTAKRKRARKVSKKTTHGNVLQDANTKDLHIVKLTHVYTEPGGLLKIAGSCGDSRRELTVVDGTL